MFYDIKQRGNEPMDNPQPMTGAELKAIRAGLGLSQVDFARRLGLSRRRLQDFEGGEPVDQRTHMAALAVKAGLDSAAENTE